MIVVLTAFYETLNGGAEQMAQEIAERLGSTYEITVITGRFRRSALKREERPAFTLYRVGLGLKYIDKLLYPWLAALKVQRLKPDIAHAVMESYAGVALVFIKRLYPRAKRILTLQSGDLDDARKQKKLGIKLFWRPIHLVPDKITAISGFLARRAERLGVKRENIRIIPNGVDLTKIPEQAEKIPNRVICVARFSWEKGIEYLIEAWPRVLKKVPTARLVFVGSKVKRGEETASRVNELIKKYKISETIEFKGALPNTQTLVEIKKSSVFICPSLAEGLGIVFIEAQACGVPPIGTRVGGIPDVIQDQENGLLIEPKDPEAIAKAIIRLLTDRELANRLSQRALITVQKYDWANIIEQINKAYQELL